MTLIKNRTQKLLKKFGIFALTLFTMLSTMQLPINASGNSVVSVGNIPGTAATVRQNGRMAQWGEIGKIQVNGEWAFCVEPLTTQLGGTYSKSDFDYTTQRTLSRIVYHGWDTSAKTDNDYAATQFMVWEALGANITWGSPYGNGSFGNIYPTLKAEIQAKIDSHEIKPSFERGSYEININETLSLYDDNNIINQFHVRNNGGMNVWIANNQLHVIPDENTPDNTSIILQKFSDEHVGASIAYNSNNGQNVGTFKLPDPLRIIINFKINKFGNIQATKVDKDTITAHGDATLQGAVYGLYANEDIINKTTGQVIHPKDSLIDTRTVDANGNMQPFEKLHLGEYYLQEMQAPQGYELNDTKVIVQVLPNDTANATVEDEIKRGQFSISKGISTDVNGSSEQLKPEVGAEFVTVLKKYVDQYGSVEEAYKYKDTFASDEWDLLVTNKNGYAQSKQLAYGTYVSKQVKGDSESLLLEGTWETVIDGDKNNEKHYIIKNQAFQPYLKIVKKDIETGDIVSFPEGGIYKVRNVDTGEFLSQKVGSQHISEFQTQNGYVVLPLKINPGNYELIEVKAPDGYLIDDTPILFTITQSNIHETDEEGDPVYVVEISNQRVKGQLEVQKYGKTLTKFENGQFIYEERPLAGAEFTLFAREDIKDPATGAVVYPKDSEIAKAISDENGIARFDNLLLGNYYVKETKVPHGYVMDENEYELNVSYVDERTPNVKVSVDVYNPKQNYELDIEKVDQETNKKLEGAVFQLEANRDIYNFDQEVIVPQGTVLEVAKSDKNGRISFKLDLPTDLTDAYKPMPIIEDEVLDSEFGVDYNFIGGVEMYGNPNSLFVIKEIEAPKGYELKQANYYFDTTYQENVPTVSIAYEATNKKIKASIQVNKVDSYSGEAIISKDFAFGLYKDEQCKNLLEKVHANQENGTATFENVEYGTYYVKEIEAPIGYMLSDEVKKIEITDTGVYVNGDKVEEENLVYSFVYQNTLLPSIVVETGDSTNTMKWIMLLSISTVIAGYTFITMRKKKEIK